MRHAYIKMFLDMQEHCLKVLSINLYVERYIAMSETFCRLLNDAVKDESRASTDYNQLIRQAKRRNFDGVATSLQMIKDQEQTHNEALQQYNDRLCR